MLGLRKKVSVVTLVLLGQLLVSILMGASVTYGAGYSKAPKGFLVWGKDLGGMTQEEAFDTLYEQIPKSVVYSDEIYPIDITQARKHLEDWLNQQYSSATDYWLTDALDYLKRIRHIPDSPQKLIEQEILPQIQGLSKRIDREGKSAKLTYENGQVVVLEGIPSIKLNQEASWEALQLSQGNEPTPLIIDTIDVHPTTAELQKVNDVLGDYTTYFNPTIIERVNNVQLAAKALDGYMIPPGGEFSFNEVVGMRERQFGYLPALMFVDKKVVYDDGGGVCQDSSTLYHAVRQANLRILERNSHSLPVSYVPAGQDATVAYGLLDFRFKNDTQGYLFVSARTGSNWIRIRIFGVSDTRHPLLNAPDGYPIRPDDWIKDPK